MSEVKTKPELETTSINYEAECEKLTMLVLRQQEMIKALKAACYNMSIVLMQDESKLV